MSDNLPAKKTLSISDAADYLGVSAETLRRWDRKGKFKAFRTKGGQRRYSFRDLEAYRLGRIKPTKLTISQAAQQIGVHPETLRRWEREGKVEPERTQGGQRRFTSEHIEDIVSEVPTPPSLAKDALPPISAEDKRVVVAETPPPPPPKPVPVRSVEHYRPVPKTSGLISKVLVSALVVLAFFGITWSLMSDLYKERLSRAFSPAPVSPIVDVNDIAGYKLSGDTVLGVLFKFPLEVEGFATKTLAVLEEAVLNTSRFLGTVFFGSDSSYFISPTGDAVFNSVTSSKVDADILSSITIEVDKLNVEDLVVSGTSTGVTGTGGGGGIATGGDADTLEGQSGSYYLNWGNFTSTPAILSSLDGVSNNEGNIDLLAGSNITITPDDGANTITISSIAGSNADTLDGLDSLQFLRSDTSDSFTSGTLTLADGTTFTANSSSITLGNTSADTLIINSLVSSDIIPIDNLQDLGSAGLRWLHVFADEINATTIVGTIEGGETVSSDWRIHADNDTADTEDVTITFERGTESPNAILRWDATLDRYRFESFPVYLDDSLTSASTVQGTQLISTITTGTAPLSVASITPVPNLNVDQLDSLDSLQLLRSDTTDNFTSGTLTTNAGTTLDVDGNLAWGGATVTENLDMATNIIENIGNGGTDFDTNGGLTLAGDLTIDGGELFLTGISSSGSTTEGTIYFDSDNSRLYVYQSGAFQELTTGLSKYSTTDATLANQDYIEIAHNQATNDLSLTAWYYDSIISQWRTVDNFTRTVDLDLANEFDPETGRKKKTDTIALHPQNVGMGDGSDGDVTFNANKNINTDDMISGRTCTEGGDAVNYSVTALTSTTATLFSSPSSGCLAAGDKILLINLRGTSSSSVNIGVNEVLTVQSVSSNTVTFTSAKTKYYGSGASDDTNIGTTPLTNQLVMLQRVPQYNDVTVDGGITLTASSLGTGAKGGVLYFKANGTVTISGTISVNSLGYSGGSGISGSDQGGYGGHTYNGQAGKGGNGSGGTGGTGQGGGGGGGGTGAGGTGTVGGGGGGGGAWSGAGGAGGGHGAVGAGGGGAPAGASGSGTIGGNGGSGGGSNGNGGGGGGLYGNSDLSTLTMGSGGAESGSGGAGGSPAGGAGAGIVFLEVNSLTVSGAITASGGGGASSSDLGGSGGGAGGAVKLYGKSLALGTNLVTATGGAGGSDTYSGGAGGVGRIAVGYTNSVTGSTNPGSLTNQLPYNSFGVFVSEPINTPDATAYNTIGWTENLATDGLIEFQTRSGNSTDPTDGTWESWKPFTVTTNYLLLESADIHTNWVGTSATVEETVGGDNATRDIDYFEDEDESTPENITKITSSTNGGYAEATPTGSPVNISSYQYITLWVRASRADTTLRFGFGEAAATEQEEDITIDVTDTWQKVYWDITDVTGTARDAVTKLRITNLTTLSNVFYIDNVRAEKLLATAGGSTVSSTPNTYIQYRTILTSTNTANFPTLSDVQINYSTASGSVTIDADSVRLLSDPLYYTNDRLDISEYNLKDNREVRSEIISEIGSTRISPIKDFDPGDGSDGSVTFAGNTNINTDDTISGRDCADGGDAVNYSVQSLTANTATLTINVSTGCLVAGDIVLFINLRGKSTAYANIGKYEILTVQSINANVVTFTTNKVNYYGDNASDDSNIGTTPLTDQLVMLQRIPQYQDVTVDSGVTLNADDLSTNAKGGVLYFKAKGTVTINGTISMANNGYDKGTARTGDDQGGYGGHTYNGQAGRGGDGGGGAGTTGQGGGGGGGGTGSGGTGTVGGGGGGGGGYNGVAGGGGGHGTVGGGGAGDPAGASGASENGGNGGSGGGSPGNGGGGGGEVGTSDLSTLTMGAGGGASGSGGGSSDGTAGGDGGGIVLIEANSLLVNGTITANGQNGSAASSSGGSGGGAGGAVKLYGRTLNLGASLVTASGGTGGNDTYDGGDGGAGRIVIGYTDTVTGSTNPGSNNISLPYNSYGVFVSDEIAITNAEALDGIRWAAELNGYGKVSLQTRSGNSTNSTDGSWEDWMPFTDGTNYTLLESADTYTNWAVTNMTRADGDDMTRNVDYFEDEDVPTAGSGQMTKLTSSTNGGYAEATISSTDISSYDYITLWVRASQAGNVLRFGFGESAATEQEEDITINTVSTWQKVYWDISDVLPAEKDAITKLRITNLTTASNTIYIDNVRAERLMADSAGSAITSTPNNYVQYRAILTTTNPLFIPKLFSVTLTYKTGYKTVQPNNNTVRLYNFTGEEQNVRLEAIVFGADLAEWYPISDLSIEAGDVVSIAGEKDEAGVPKVRKSSVISDQRAVGIISTRAGVELGIPRDDRRLVGLSGRVPVKIAPDSASIQAGDLLTSSGTYPGMAQKATSPGFIVAKALDSWDPNSPTDSIESFITVIWADPKVLVDQDGDAAKVVESDEGEFAEEEEAVEQAEEDSASEGNSEEAEQQEQGDTTEDQNEQEGEEEQETVKILPQIEAQEGIFERLVVSIEAVFESIKVKTAEITSAFIENLTAVFIKAEKIEAGKIETGEILLTGETSGQATVLAGESELQVANLLVIETSRVFVTFRDSYQPASRHWVSEIKDGEGFTVTLDEPVEFNARFDFWIINHTPSEDIEN